MTSAPQPGTGSHRFFFALWPDDAVRDALARSVAQVAAFEGDGRAVAAAEYHITLHYLGGWSAYPGDIVERARAAAGTVEASAFHLVVDGAGGFRGARVGWLAPAGNSGLDALWSGLRHALDGGEVPYRAHARFSPHVTVLRDVRGPLAETSIEPLSWPVGDFVLVHSHAGRYDIVERWPLRAAG